MSQTIPSTNLDRSHIAPVKTCEELIYLLSRPPNWNEQLEELLS